MHSFLVIFATILIAEFGDKTQLATLLFATSGQHSPTVVFAAVIGALSVTTAAAVALGSVGSAFLTTVPLKLIAGIGFILIGLWTLYEHFTLA